MSRVRFTGFSLLRQAELRAALRREQIVLDSPVTIEAERSIPFGHNSALWYAGEVAVIHYRGWKFRIVAYGDVDCCLVENERPRNIIARISDRQNFGLFGDVMSRYFRNDEQFLSALRQEHPRYHLIIREGNWWRCFPTGPAGTLCTESRAVDGDHFPDAVAQVMAAIPDVISRDENDR